jgi:sulfate/thiosulfate transport system permease protein
MASAAETLGRQRRRVLPARTAKGLRHLALRGTAITYLVALVAVPIAAIVVEGFGDGLGAFRSAMASPGAWEAVRLTLVTSALAAIINAVFGTILAYVLVRYRFRGRGLISSVVDLPFAIPTLVTGVMLMALYGPNSPIGRFLGSFGLGVGLTQFGILIALTVVTLPFVVRTVQPVLLELDEAEEEAAMVLGASPWTTFRRIVMPAIRPAIAAGALLAFARSIGEFGSVVLLSGNITGKTLTAPVFIFQLANQFRPQEAAAVATMLFVISFVLVLLINRLVRVGRMTEEAS